MSQLISSDEDPALDFLPVRYRLVDPYEDDQKPILEYWYIVKKTPTGAWVAQAWSLSRHTAAMQYSGIEYQWPTRFGAQASREWMHLGRDELRKRGARFVLDGDGKRYAHETIEWARSSYKLRKKWQIRHAERSKRRAQNALHWLDTGRTHADEERLAMDRLYGTPPSLEVRPF